jgi:predicted metal-binding transcription factor (methanogenesis marker protein 9)
MTQQKEYYQSKVKACEYLAGLNKKKIEQKDFKEASEMFGLKISVIKLSWNNTLKFGKADRRVKSGKYIGAEQFASATTPYYPIKNLSDQDIEMIVKEYMVNKKSHRYIVDKYKINSNQFYSLIDELNVSGDLGSKKSFLNWKKYLKRDIKLARKRNLDVNLKRILTVFKTYIK